MIARLSPLAASAALLLAACGRGEQASEPANAAAESPPAAAPAPARADRWELQSGGEGVALALLSASGEATVRLFCPARRRELLVNVPGFRPVGSEERLSFGSGGEVVALVADTRGDSARGGVTGTGPVPGNLAALLGGPVAVNYGAQDSGPHPAPPPDLARAFAAACSGGAGQPSPAPPAPTPAPPSAPPAGVSACLVQDGERLDVAPLRALGTEPFWAARIEGRCVTYSHPDDQDGTRVWTRYAALPGGGARWSGALGGRRFELTARPQPGCSDGMSDRRYPMAVELIVHGERRRGCADRR